jgi:Fe-S cluster assembly ATPase SufC
MIGGRKAAVDIAIAQLLVVVFAVIDEGVAGIDIARWARRA